MKTEEQKHTALCLLWSTQHTTYGYRGGQMVSTHQVWTFTDLSARFANSCIVGRKHRPESLFYRNSRNAQCLWGTAEHMELEIRGPPSSPSNRSGSVWSEANTSTTVLFCCIFLPKCVIFNYLNTTLHLQIYSIKNWVTSTHIPSKKKKKTFFESQEEKKCHFCPLLSPPFCWSRILNGLKFRYNWTRRWSSHSPGALIFSQPASSALPVATCCWAQSRQAQGPAAPPHILALCTHPTPGPAPPLSQRDRAQPNFGVVFNKHRAKHSRLPFMPFRSAK